ncbi:hypothetical protein CBL_11532 [Carabus blaptoides fortunei]
MSSETKRSSSLKSIILCNDTHFYIPYRLYHPMSYESNSEGRHRCERRLRRKIPAERLVLRTSVYSKVQSQLQCSAQCSGYRLPCAGHRIQRMTADQDFTSSPTPNNIEASFENCICERMVNDTTANTVWTSWKIIGRIHNT